MSELFKHITTKEPIADVIQSVFDITLPVEGGWGYSLDDALKLLSPLPAPVEQVEDTLASMRAHLEMYVLLPKEKRYGGITLNVSAREEHKKNTKHYHIVTYTLTAMRESDYSKFIKAYKEGYEKEDFDISAHFEARKRASISRQSTFYFDVTEVI